MGEVPTRIVVPETFDNELALSFMAAIDKLTERNDVSKYRNVWKNSKLGTRGTFALLYAKSDRLFQQIWEMPEEEWPLEEALDSALDAFHYAVFTHALLRMKKEAAVREFVAVRVDELEGIVTGSKSHKFEQHPHNPLFCRVCGKLFENSVHVEGEYKET